MTPVRRASASTLAALVILAGGLLLAASARAASDPESGWWWSANPKPPLGAEPTPLPVPGVDATVQSPQPPSPVDEDQLQVSATPNGATAVAAVYYRLDASETDPVLTLKLDAESSTGVEGAVVRACQLGDRFNGGGAQFWDDRPRSTCDVSVDGVLGADGTTMTFDLSGMVAFGDLIVELRPGAPATFTAVFEPPEEGVLATSVAPPSNVPPVANTAPPLTPPPAPAPGGAAGGVAAPPSVSDLARGATVETTPPAATPTTGPPVAVVGGPEPLDAEPITNETPSRPVALALLLLVFGGVGVWYAALRPSDADFGPTGGLGRFTAERAGAPPPLR